MRALIVCLMAVVVMLAGCVQGTAQPRGTWTWYEKTQGTAHVDSLRIKTACMGAEDSAAHLNLVDYGNGTAVYRCNPRKSPSCQSLTAWVKQIAHETYRPHYHHDLALAREGKSLACSY